MTLSNVRDWLKELFPEAEHFYVGALDRKQLQSIGVYSRDSRGASPEIALGGMDSTRTLRKEVSILVHWNRNAAQTEAAAQRLCDRLLGCTSATIGRHQVDYLRLKTSESVDVGTDETGVYERVVWLDIYYQKE